MAVVVLSSILQPELPKPELVYARQINTQTGSTEPSNTWIKPQVQNVAAAESAAPSQAADSNAAEGSDKAAASPKANISKEPAASPVQPAPAPVAATAPPLTAPAVTVTNVPAPAVAVPDQKPQPQFRLNGIIYTPASPSAIVNGVTVRVGDSVDGATVLSITSTRVNLQIDTQRKALDLR